MAYTLPAALANGNTFSASWITAARTSLTQLQTDKAEKAGSASQPFTASTFTEGTTTLLDKYAPAGMIVPFAGITPPAGWLICDGSQVSRSTYARLFQAMVIQSSGQVVDPFTITNIPDISKMQLGMMVISYDWIEYGAEIDQVIDANTIMLAGGMILADPGQPITFEIAPYGEGDGITTFNLPDLRWGIPFGAGDGAGALPDYLQGKNLQFRFANDAGGSLLPTFSSFNYIIRT
jgi:microcystin-dependent protein